MKIFIPLSVLALVLGSKLALAGAPPLPLTRHPTADELRDWQELFSPDLSNAKFTRGEWVMDRGELTKHGPFVGRALVWTKQTYGDFILDLEFKISPCGNSGVMLRAGDTKNWLHTAIEIDINDSYGEAPRRKHPDRFVNGRGICGEVYDCLKPAKNSIKRPGEWNRYTIACHANRIYVVLNDEAIIDMDLDRWTEPHANPDGTPNKFNTAYKHMPRRGAIGFQDHQSPVWFRNLRIHELVPADAK